MERVKEKERKKMMILLFQNWDYFITFAVWYKFEIYQ